MLCRAEVVEGERGQQVIVPGEGVVGEREHRGPAARVVPQPPGRGRRGEAERAAKLRPPGELPRVPASGLHLEQRQPLGARAQRGARVAHEELAVGQAAQDLADGVRRGVRPQPLARPPQVVQHVGLLPRPDRAGQGERRRGRVADLLVEPERLVEVPAAPLLQHPHQQPAADVARQVSEPHQEPGLGRQPVVRAPERERALVLGARLLVAAEVRRAVRGLDRSRLEALDPVPGAQGVLQHLLQRAARTPRPGSASATSSTRAWRRRRSGPRSSPSTASRVRA